MEIANKDLKSDNFSSRVKEAIIFPKKIDLFISAINSLEYSLSLKGVDFKNQDLQNALLKCVKKGELKIDLRNVRFDNITNKIEEIIGKFSNEAHSDQARIKPTSPRVSGALTHSRVSGVGSAKNMS